MSNLIANTKLGLIVGTIEGIVILIWFLFSPSRGPLLPGYEQADILFFIFTICIPIIFSGVISGSIIEGLFIKKYILTSQMFLNYRAGSIIGCIIGGVVFFPIAVFIGIVIGGFSGGNIGDTISNKFGIGNIGIAIGIAVGISLIIIIVTLLGSILGGLVGLAFNNVVRKMTDIFFSK